MAADSSTSAQKRRVTKPLIEKRRRARINSSLAQLKDMVAKTNANSQENRSNRLEKADILEMTVEYVKKIHCSRLQKDQPSSDPSSASDAEQSFEKGYRLCMFEVQNFFFKNYRKQATKEFLNRSIQNYLQQKFQRTLTNERQSIEVPSATSFASSTSSQKTTQNSYISKSEKYIRKTEKRQKNIEEHYEFHSESSNLGSNYSSASTDDEMSENLSVSDSKDSNGLRKYLPQKVGISNRNAIQHNGHAFINTTENMWRPW